MHCSLFDGNLAADGAAVNLAYYSAKFANVTFSNSIESTIRVSLYCTYIRVCTIFVVIFVHGR